MRLSNKNYRKLVIYLLVGVAGLSIMVIGSLFQNIVIPKEQQDFLHYLNYNFTKPMGVVFFIVGIAIGYFSKSNPLIAGLCLFFVFPLTSLIDAIINPGRHLWNVSKFFCLQPSQPLPLNRETFSYLSTATRNEDIVKSNQNK